ncbi:hypothetical protein ACFL6S_29905 [Candidatus Poribacteria bacterium]
MANFPFLSANLCDGMLGKLLFEPYTIKEVDGVKLGIFGLISNRYEWDHDLMVDDPHDIARDIIAELKEKKCDMIIALTDFVGIDGNKKLAEQVPDINIIVGGHTNSKPLDTVKINNSIILYPYFQGRYLGRLDLTIRNGILDFYDASPANAAQSEGRSQYVNTLIPMNDSVDYDPDVQELVDEYKQLRMDLLRAKAAPPEAAAAER